MNSDLIDAFQNLFHSAQLLQNLKASPAMMQRGMLTAHLVKDLDVINVLLLLYSCAEYQSCVPEGLHSVFSGGHGRVCSVSCESSAEIH